MLCQRVVDVVIQEFNHFHRPISMTLLPSCPFFPSLHSCLLSPLLLACSSSSSVSSWWTSSPDNSHTGRGGADSGYLGEVRLWNRPPVLSWPQASLSQFMIPYRPNADLALLSPHQHFMHSFANLVLSWELGMYIYFFSLSCAMWYASQMLLLQNTLLWMPSEIV